MTTAGSTVGAGLTYWIGKKVGAAGLERLVDAKRLERIRARIGSKGAVTMALPAVLPPPFPLTPFVLACGALEVDAWRFFLTFSGARIIRFGIEALLARRYGRGILRVLESDTFQMVVIGFVVVAVVGTVISGITLWRKTRDPRPQMA